MELKKTLAALAVSAMCASFNANAVIQIDTTGGGNIAGSTTVAGIDWSPGNLVFDQGAGVDNNNARLLGQGFKQENGINFTYQFDIPIVSTRVDSTARIITGGTGTFKLFMDPTPNNNQATGLGFGTLNGATGGGLDQVELLSGNVNIVLGGFSMDNTLPAAGTQFWLSQNNTVDTIATLGINGSFSLAINVLTQAAGYVVNDMVNAGLNFDMNAITLGPLAPFDPNEPASTVVVDSGALDYGAAEALGVIVDPNTGFPDATQPGGSRPLNDFDCAGNVLGNCDAQFQTSGNTTFFGKAVPEPGTLAMLGLGLSLFGASRRRKAAA